MSELHHECGVAAVYHLPSVTESPLCADVGRECASFLLPRMLQDIQNRGQLAAGMTTYNAHRSQLLETHKDIGTVSEVFRLSHRGKHESIMQQLAGPASIGHVRYATCGQDDRNYAQPFERQHIHKHKWFSFCFNGQLANYNELKDRLTREGDHHLARDTDTEIILHELGRELTISPNKDLVDVFSAAAKNFDGAYSLALLNAKGELMLARDPQGIKPLCYAFDGSLFAAASESVALLNLGFTRSAIQPVPPGTCIRVNETGVSTHRYSEVRDTAHCFFEWIYFANVASTLDDRSVYLSRTRLGEELARIELARNEIPLDSDTIVVPVPDTSKAAADAMAYRLRIPCREGLIRNRYSGRTFIEGNRARKVSAAMKYTPLREVLEGKRVILVEDSIVRSTTMKVLLKRIRELGGAREIHVRVACPPIVAPCFYGIDMSTIAELYAPRFLNNGEIDDEVQRRMAEELECDSLRYLPVDSIARAIDLPASQLCQACITRQYPTPFGQKLYQVAQNNHRQGLASARTYELNSTAIASS
ncbi:MAG: amidophosphoribosyltransferase [Planctomycetes bacterium]|nr:amidophosphoribosyltransferase [Planctomycetota bacterium]